MFIQSCLKTITWNNAIRFIIREMLRLQNATLYYSAVARNVSEATLANGVHDYLPNVLYCCFRIPCITNLTQKEQTMQASTVTCSCTAVIPTWLTGIFSRNISLKGA